MVDGSNASLFPQYGYAQAGQYPDPTQWSNPYSNFNSGALPFPPGYVGAPVNAATGQPIQGYQPPPPQAPQPMGTTLNSGGPPATFGWNPQGMPNGGQYSGPGTTFGAQGGSNMLPPQPLGQGVGQGMGAGQGGGMAGSNPASMLPANQSGSYQAALNALANPGTPQMQGSPFTQAQATAGNGGQGVLNNFIQNWKQGGIGQTAQPGIGGGSSGISFGANNPFFASLGAKK